VGTKLFNAVFEHSTQQMKLALPDLIRHEAGRGRPAVLSVAQTGPVSPAADLVPWASIYDLPIDPEADEEEYEFCRSVEEFGPTGRTLPIPSHCPYSDDNGHSDIICPFGFWGLSCIIELPPATERDVRDVVSNGTAPITVQAAADTGLNLRLRNAHDHNLQALAAKNGATATMQHIEERGRLRQLLAGEMDIAYLYSHGIPDHAATGVLAGTRLTFGKAKVTADTIISWSRNRTAWPPPHWDERRPLVVLNGCHTTEQISRMLVGFVPAFVRSAGASGVVGTETAIDQDVANIAGELLIEHLLSGATVGAAIRAMRWQMLAKGNVMGLTYTRIAWPACGCGLAETEGARRDQRHRRGILWNRRRLHHLPHTGHDRRQGVDRRYRSRCWCPWRWRDHQSCSRPARQDSLGTRSACSAAWSSSSWCLR
jgi:CHAT domain-containing protein